MALKVSGEEDFIWDAKPGKEKRKRRFLQKERKRTVRGFRYERKKNMTKSAYGDTADDT